MAQKILIIRFSSIGDIVLTTPIMRAVKQQLNAEIHYLTKPQYSSLLENNPHIDRLIELPKQEQQLWPMLKKEKYDVVLDLHNNLRSRRFSMFLGTRVYRFNKINWAKWVMVNFKINLLPDEHIVDRYFKTCKKLGITNDQLGLDYFHQLRAASLEDFGLTPDTYVVYAIGGQHQTKKLPPKGIKDLLSKINKKVVLLGGKEDMAVGEIAESFNHVVNLCGKTNLHQSALIIELAEAVITHDSGMMHIAAAFKKKIISLWGNTLPEFGMYPYLANHNSKSFEVMGLGCRPCSKIGFKQCPKGHFNCMQQQDLPAIADAINH